MKFIQDITVHRGHHNPDPDLTTVGMPTWTPAFAAADVYAREPSIEGMTAEMPVVSTRTYEVSMPATFEREVVDIGRDLGEDLGFTPDEMKYIAEKYGDSPTIWQITNDPAVQDMFRRVGADSIIYPETFASMDKRKVDDGMGEIIDTFRPLYPYEGETVSLFTGREQLQDKKNQKALKARLKEYGGDVQRWLE